MVRSLVLFMQKSRFQDIVNVIFGQTKKTTQVKFQTNVVFNLLDYTLFSNTQLF